MKASWKWLLYSSMGLGLLLVLGGVSLAMFSDISVSMGVHGVQIIAGIIGLGLLLLVPSKILLTLLLMRQKSTEPPANNKG
jgi:membrane protein implicated in regulation of membrane protease activity